jgi:hypothetical protein
MENTGNGNKINKAENKKLIRKVDKLKHKDLLALRKQMKKCWELVTKIEDKVIDLLI